MASLRRSARVSSGIIETTSATVTSQIKRKAVTDPAGAEAVATASPPAKKRRGRPPSAAAAPVSVDEDAQRRAESPPRTRPPLPPPQTPTAKSRHPAIRRLASPSATNAMLLSPETSRIVSALPLDPLSTPKGGKQRRQQPEVTAPSAVPAPDPDAVRTTTANILEEACAHLTRVEPRMKALIDKHYCKVFSPESLAETVDPFESLASGIISQQVSGAAARAIKGRFIELFLGGAGTETGTGVTGAADERRRFPQPSQVAAMPVEKLRTAGLSQRKAEYLQGLAAQFASGQLTAQLLADAPYETLLERLLAVRGLGRWSVEMFALFGLKRMDVFSVGDLGVQRGMAAFAGRDVAKLKRAGSSGGTASAAKKKWKYMTDTEMEAMAEPFRPYRSVFMWYMWQVEATDVSSME